jgi:hypothetical protein
MSLGLSDAKAHFFSLNPSQLFCASLQLFWIKIQQLLSTSLFISYRTAIINTEKN